MIKLTSEVVATAGVASFTGLIWVPVIANRLVEMGPWKALKNPEPDVRPHAEWAYRLMHAHRNAIENLVVFAPLALLVQMLGLNSPLTAAACSIFLVARIAHAAIYTFGVPFLRTIAFAVGVFCQAALALRVFGLV